MNGKNALLIAIFLLTACSRLETLTPDVLSQAESRWTASNVFSYRMVVEMKGDRVDKEQFDVSVAGGKMVELRRNGQVVRPSAEQDYSMPGLFHMLHQELDLAARPNLLGAPDGYSAYLMVRFDDKTGALQQYRRTVGGTTNTIDIRVIALTPQR